VAKVVVARFPFIQLSQARALRQQWVRAEAAAMRTAREPVELARQGQPEAPERTATLEPVAVAVAVAEMARQAQARVARAARAGMVLLK
jgi:hypothetical protein